MADDNVEPLDQHRRVRQRATPLALVELGKFIDSEPEPRLFIDEQKLIPMRNVTLLSGDGGTGKSLLALQLALACSSVLSDWIGIAVESGPVIYLSAEDDENEIHNRLREIWRAEEADPERGRGMLHVLNLAGLDATLAIEQARNGTVKATELFNRLDSTVEDFAPLLLILDNLADVFAGDENHRSAVKHFVGLLRRLAIQHDCAILLLAHPSLSGLNSGSGTSGSTAWSNSVRSRIYLHRVLGDGGHEADPAVRVLETMKANYAAKGLAMGLRWDSHRFVSEAMPKPFDNVTTHHLELVQAAFRGGEWRDSERSETWGGYFVADLLDLDVGRGLGKEERSDEHDANRKRLRHILATWMRNKAIKITQREDQHRKLRGYYDA